MRIRWVLGMVLVLLLAGALPASAQMMGGGSGMAGAMGMMGQGMHEPAGGSGSPGMAGQPVAFDQKGPWISLALDHAEELDLSVDQVKGLTALRKEFQKEADLKLGRVKTLEQGKALLTSEQQQKLGRIAQGMGWLRGAFMMGSPPGFTR